jgi:NAD(P)-dependent dehydrogenase (short-subunit alcohol dehydrogenase family)
MNAPVVVITGASRGIGAAIVKKFHSEGWRVVGCSRTAESLPSCDLTVTCDVSDSTQVREFARQVQEKYGRVRAVINNAGLAGETNMDPTSTDDSWSDVLHTNLSAVFYMAKQFAPLMEDRSGRLISIASVLGLKGVPDQPAYCAAKHGVIGLTRSLSHFLAPRKITVNAICPGWVRTDMALGRMKELHLSEQTLSAGVPLGRFIEPIEVAEFAFFLCSPGASMITGQALTIDGGVLA